MLISKIFDIIVMILLGIGLIAGLIASIYIIVTIIRVIVDIIRMFFAIIFMLLFGLPPMEGDDWGDDSSRPIIEKDSELPKEDEDCSDDSSL